MKTKNQKLTIGIRIKTHKKIYPRVNLEKKLHVTVEPGAGEVLNSGRESSRSQKVLRPNLLVELGFAGFFGIPTHREWSFAIEILGLGVHRCPQEAPVSKLAKF